MISAIDCAGIISVAVRQQDPETACGMLTSMSQAGCGFNIKMAQFDNPVDGIIFRVEVDFKGTQICEAGWAMPEDEAGGGDFLFED